MSTKIRKGQKWSCKFWGLCVVTKVDSPSRKEFPGVSLKVVEPPEKGKFTGPFEPAEKDDEIVLSRQMFENGVYTLVQ